MADLVKIQGSSKIQGGFKVLEPITSSMWILITGFWRDIGLWIDREVWID